MKLKDSVDMNKIHECIAPKGLWRSIPDGVKEIGEIEIPYERLDEEKVRKFIQEFYNDGNIELDVSQAICQKFGTKKVEVDEIKLDNLISLKLAQLLVENKPEGINGYTKSGTLTYAIKQAIEKREVIK